MLEKGIENAILDYLKSINIFCWKNHSVGIYDKKTGNYRKAKGDHHINGVSDILGILPDGRFLALEVKTPRRKNYMTQSQINFIINIEACGGVAKCVCSVDEARQLMESLGYDKSRESN
jgi:hypothetical protein